MTGRVAGLFDPLGLKLDLHELCMLRLDWDNPVPMELLDKWVANIHKMEELQEVRFR